jgi:hypothetical protein
MAFVPMPEEWNWDVSASDKTYRYYEDEEWIRDWDEIRML